MPVLSSRTKQISDRLARALPASYKELRDFRADRAELLRDYAGRTTYAGYDDFDLGIDDDSGTRRKKQILNLTMQAAEAFTMNLAANRPQFLVTSRYARYDAFANKMGRALDRYAQELYLEEVLQDVARDSFFTLGIAKVYQADSLAVGIEADYRMDPGRPFVQRVSLDRFVYDTTASTVEESAFFADVYSLPFEQAIRDKRFSKPVRDLIKEKGPGPQRSNEETGETIATSDETDQPIEDVVFFADVYLRSRRAVWTYLVEKDFTIRHDEPIQRVKWKGEECGPYYFLNMGPIPDHFMPSTPGMNGRLLVQLVNALYRKLEDQARRQKQFMAGRLGNEKDAEAARTAQDGEVKMFEDPDSVQAKRFDGPDQNLFGFTLNALDQHSAINANLKQKLGLGPSADTAKQEAMIGAAVSRLEAFYQQRYVSFVRRLARGLARLLYDDQMLEVPGSFNIPGTSFSVDDTWKGAGTDGARLGDYSFYRVDIDPYSMAYKSPGERAAIIDAEMAKWIPAFPFLAQLGIQPDMAEYFDVKANYTTPELRRIFKSNQPPLPPSPGGPETISAGGPHVYEHRSSSSGPSPEAQQMQYFQAGSQQEGE